MHNALVNVNGEIMKGDKASISVFDRSYLYGDSLYEVVRTYEGVPFYMDEHLDRLRNSTKLARMHVTQTMDELKHEMQKTIDAFLEQSGNVDAYCRIVLSRGAGQIGFSEKCVSKSLFTIIVKPIQSPTREALEKGAKLKTSTYFRNHPNTIDPAMKSGNYLNCVLAFLEAEKEGYDDAILCDSNGFVTEGTTFNIFYINRGILATPPLSVGILPGITRALIFKSAKELDLPMREVEFPVERLYEADEVFISGSVREIYPVTSLDGKIIGKGKTKGKFGAMTLKLYEKYQIHVKETISRTHP